MYLILCNLTMNLEPHAVELLGLISGPNISVVDFRILETELSALALPCCVVLFFGFLVDRSLNRLLFLYKDINTVHCRSR